MELLAVWTASIREGLSAGKLVESDRRPGNLRSGRICLKSSGLGAPDAGERELDLLLDPEAPLAARLAARERKIASQAARREKKREKEMAKKKKALEKLEALTKSDVVT